jgi:hypothetical protein
LKHLPLAASTCIGPDLADTGHCITVENAPLTEEWEVGSNHVDD